MRFKSLLFPALALAGTLGNAQDVGPGGWPIFYQDLRPKEFALCRIKADGAFQNVQRMAIPVELLGSTDITDTWTYEEWDAGALAVGKLMYLAGTANITDSDSFFKWISDKQNDPAFMQYCQQAKVILQDVINLISPNAFKRMYTFTVPTRANYAITVNFKGSLIKPRNTFHLTNESGIVFSAEDNPSNDETLTYNLTLEPGVYNAVVGLGSGASVTFHSAGSLSSVQLSEPQGISFTMPLTVAVKSFVIQDSIASNGGQAIFQVSLNDVPTTPIHPAILAGNPNVALSNFHADSHIYFPPVVSTVDGGASTPYWVYSTMFMKSEPTLPTFNGFTATYSVQRGADFVNKLQKNRQKTF
jgi:hypothetical protein